MMSYEELHWSWGGEGVKELGRRMFFGQLVALANHIVGLNTRPGSYFFLMKSEIIARSCAA